MTNHDIESPAEDKQPLQGRMDLESAAQNSPIEQEIKGPTVIENHEAVNALTDNQLVTSSQLDTSHQTAKPKRFWLFMFLSVTLLASSEFGLFVKTLIQQGDLLAGLWLAIFTVIAVLTAKQVFHEWLGLRRLKRQQVDRLEALQLFDSPAIGRGQEFCSKVAAQLPKTVTQEVELWHQQLQPHFNDKETLALFEKVVIAKADNVALSSVTSHASAASAMIAVSPFALLDMLIVLWRNFKMLHQISDAYGVKLSYWGRIRLIRNVFSTMLYAGASEIIADAGSYALGAGLTGKLSARLAQGLSAGVLTARIGIKAIDECRPMPWLTETRPGINAVTSELLVTLKKHVI